MFADAAAPESIAARSARRPRPWPCPSVGDDFWYPTEVFEAPNRGAHKVRKRLRARRLRVRIVARAQHHHKQLHVVDLAGVCVDHSRFLARIVEKCLLATRCTRRIDGFSRTRHAQYSSQN